jgi:glycosyltransferase involved in cell wall biosynthesis
MRIVIWNSYYGTNFGGSETSVNVLLRGIQQRGFKAALVTNGRRRGDVFNPYLPSLPPGIEVHCDSFPDLLLWKGPKAFAIDLWRYSRATLNLLSFLRRRRPDVVHLHLVTFDVFLLLLYRHFFKYRLVIGFRGSDLWDAKTSALVRFKVRLALRCADAITSLSQHMTAYLRDEFGVHGVVCIPNGIDPEALRSAAQHAAPVIPPDHFVYCGRLHYDKQIPRIIEIFMLCLDAGCDRNLFIIGDGPERDVIIRLICRYGLAGRVVVLGPISYSAVLSTLAQARCLLLASTLEGLPNIVLEAMTLGIPVIAAAVGGLPELVAHGETGYLFPPENTQMARDYILRLAQDPEQARAMGRRGAEVVCDRFPLAAAVNRHIELYESVLRNQRSHH